MEGVGVPDRKAIEVTAFVSEVAEQLIELPPIQHEVLLIFRVDCLVFP